MLVRSILFTFLFSLLLTGCPSSGSGNTTESGTDITDPVDDDSGNDDSGNDDSGNDDSGNDDSGNDDSGNDDSGNDDSGNDDSGNDDSGNDDSGNDDSGNDDSGNDDSGNDDSGNDDPWAEIVGFWKNPQDGNSIGNFRQIEEGTYTLYVYDDENECYNTRVSDFTYVSEGTFALWYEYDAQSYLNVLYWAEYDGAPDLSSSDFPLEGRTVFDYWVEDGMLYSHWLSFEIGEYEYPAVNQPVYSRERLEMTQEHLESLLCSEKLESRFSPIDLIAK
ncbi:hypothetical protein [Pleionea sediminis]|uniref:hypothetical protein n=1 Tax=Pleionea sediminis TaxID=2569479 RepID=UPI001FE89DB6|nr:hypothetical protein [Pleionea sediminis]